MREDWTLRLSFTGPFGEHLVMAIEVPADIARNVSKVDPPSRLAPFERMLDKTVTALKRKEFRKELFIAEATRLGALLVERKEDAEGWHDASRMDPARQQLIGRAVAKQKTGADHG